MGLMDTMAAVMISRAVGNERAPLVKAALDLFNQYGGANGIMDKFREHGYGEHVDSWIGNGPNMPITPQQVKSVLGACILDEISQHVDLAQMGYTHQQISQKLANHLPTFIDKLSPDGQLPNNSAELLIKAASIFKKK